MANPLTGKDRTASPMWNKSTTGAVTLITSVGVGHPHNGYTRRDMASHWLSFPQSGKLPTSVTRPNVTSVGENTPYLEILEHQLTSI